MYFPASTFEKERIRCLISHLEAKKNWKKIDRGGENVEQGVVRKKKALGMTDFLTQQAFRKFRTSIGGVSLTL